MDRNILEMYFFEVEAALGPARSAVQQLYPRVQLGRPADVLRVVAGSGIAATGILVARIRQKSAAADRSRRQTGRCLYMRTAASTNVDVFPVELAGADRNRGMSQQPLTVPPPHYHIWRVALTGRAAFMSRPYGKRDAATQAARRWSMEAGWRMVQECKLGENCPRQPVNER